jgi:hypothetical protein
MGACVGASGSTLAEFRYDTSGAGGIGENLFSFGEMNGGAVAIKVDDSSGTAFQGNHVVSLFNHDQTGTSPAVQVGTSATNQTYINSNVFEMFIASPSTGHGIDVWGSNNEIHLTDTSGTHDYAAYFESSACGNTLIPRQLGGTHSTGGPGLSCNTIVDGSSSGGVAGSDTQIQLNNAGSLGASSDLTWTTSAKMLYVGGSATLRGSGYTAAASTATNGLTLHRADNWGTQGIFFGTDTSGAALNYWEHMLIYNQGGGGDIIFLNGSAPTEHMRLTAGGDLSLAAGSIDVVGGGYKIGGTTAIDSSRNGSFVGLTVGTLTGCLQAASGTVSATGCGASLSANNTWTGTNAFHATTILDRGDGYASALSFNPASGPTWDVYATSTAKSLNFYNRTTSSPGLLIDVSNNVTMPGTLTVGALTGCLQASSGYIQAGTCYTGDAKLIAGTGGAPQSFIGTNSFSTTSASDSAVIMASTSSGATLALGNSGTGSALEVSGNTILHRNDSGFTTFGQSEWQPNNTNTVALGDATHTFADSYFHGLTLGSLAVGSGGFSVVGGSGVFLGTALNFAGSTILAPSGVAPLSSGSPINCTGSQHVIGFTVDHGFVMAFTCS